MPSPSWLDITDLCDEGAHLVTEAFFNQHNLFVMITEQRARRLGCRIRVQAG